MYQKVQYRRSFLMFRYWVYPRNNEFMKYIKVFFIFSSWIKSQSLSKKKYFQIFYFKFLSPWLCDIWKIIRLQIMKPLECSKKYQKTLYFYQFFVIIAESFYYVNYELSITMSKVIQIISVMKTETLSFLLSLRQNVN